MDGRTASGDEWVFEWRDFIRRAPESSLVRQVMNTHRKHFHCCCCCCRKTHVMTGILQIADIGTFVWTTAMQWCVVRLQCETRTLSDPWVNRCYISSTPFFFFSSGLSRSRSRAAFSSPIQNSVMQQNAAVGPTHSANWEGKEIKCKEYSVAIKTYSTSTQTKQVNIQQLHSDCWVSGIFQCDIHFVAFCTEWIWQHTMKENDFC